MLEWLIIGGGVHGVHLAHMLVHGQGVPADSVRILDPHDRLLTVWNRRTANTGMRYLRSPRVHHVDLDPASLEQFAKEQEAAPSDLWIDPYYRPSYSLFQNHCQYVIAKYNLDGLHMRGQALALHRVERGWCVETASTTITAERVLLATGQQQLRSPEWTKPLVAQSALIQHVFDSTFDSKNFRDNSTVFVVGGGISAGQIALKLMYDHKVTMVTRQPLRHHDFDSSPCWIGPKCLKAFGQADYRDRRKMIGEARQTGTMAQDIFEAVRTAVQENQIYHHRNEVIAADLTGDNQLLLTLLDGTQHVADQVILATGLQPVPPQQTWLADAVMRYRLPVASCGYPILDRTLRWAEGLYASGPLAELELGPVSANIAGARAAAERLSRIEIPKRKNAARTL